MGATAEQMASAVDDVVKCFSDGFQLSDVVKAVRVAMEIAETTVGLPAGDRKAFVVAVIRKAYREVDPNIPWVPEPIETWIENYVLDNLVPAAIELVIDATKGKIKVNGIDSDSAD